MRTITPERTRACISAQKRSHVRYQLICSVISVGRSLWRKQIPILNSCHSQGSSPAVGEVTQRPGRRTRPFIERLGDAARGYMAAGPPKFLLKRTPLKFTGGTTILRLLGRFLSGQGSYRMSPIYIPRESTAVILGVGFCASGNFFLSSKLLIKYLLYLLIKLIHQKINKLLFIPVSNLIHSLMIFTRGITYLECREMFKTSCSRQCIVNV